MHKKEIIAITGLLFLVIFIGLLYLSNNNITGAVVAEEVQENVLYGTYSIKPNFKVNVDYNFDDYTLINSKLNIIENCVEEGNEIDLCIENLNKEIQENEETQDFEWSLNCQEGAEIIFYEFAEFYQNCFESEDNNCICKHALEKTKEEIEKYNLEGDYKIIIKESEDRKNIDLELSDIDLKYKINKENTFSWAPDEYTISYNSEGKPRAKLSFFYNPNKLVEKDYFLENLNEITLYKFDDRYEDRKQNEIQFMRYEDAEITFIDGEKRQADELKACSIKPKNIHRFCVKNKKKEFLVYDKIKGKAEFENPVIRFAAYIPDSPPAEIKNVEVFDRPKDDKSVILKWDKNKEKDVVKYRVYYAESGLKIFENGYKVEDIKKDVNVHIMDFNIDEISGIEAYSLVPKRCDFDYEKKKCIFESSAGGVELDYNIALFFEVEDKYYVSFKVPDNKEYDFIVTAIDRNGNEIEEKKKEQIKTAKSIDNLPPDSQLLAFFEFYNPETKEISLKIIRAPDELTNIDGAELEDFFSYKIYYLKYAGLETIDEKKQIKDSLQDFELSKFKPLGSFEFSSETVKMSINETEPKIEDTYFFIVVAEDTNGNPKQAEFKLKELGAEPLVYTIQ